MKNPFLRWRRALRLVVLVSFIGVLLCLAGPSAGLGAETSGGMPWFSVNLNGEGDPAGTSVVMQIFLLMTVLSLAPAILIMVTSFTRIVIVLSVVRQAIGTQSMPPSQVVIGLALFLTLFVMTPVWQKVHQEAVAPYFNQEISQREALEKATGPLRRFMASHTREKDLAMMIDVARAERPDAIENVPITVLIPSFIISELKTAFQISFMLYVPFLIIDMVVASVLLSMGMMMLPPVMISLPFKLMLFVLADGWHLIVGSLVKGFIV